MKAVSPVVPGRELPEIKYAEHQEEYETLPVVVLEAGRVLLARFELDDIEKQFIVDHGYFYLYVSTFGQPLQPVLPTIDPPEFPREQIVQEVNP